VNQLDLNQQTAIVMDGPFTNVDLTLSPQKLAETKSSLKFQSDALLKTFLIVKDGLFKDAQTSQPSLEHGAEQLLLDIALQELKDFNQSMSQSLVTVMDNLFTDVDLTL
jgi:hypothetical protein